VVLECHGRRERLEAVDADEDLGAEDRVRLHHFSFALVERARLAQDLERDASLANVMQERRLAQCRSRRRIEAELTADQQAQRRHVHRMAVGEVFVQLDCENLSERGAAAGDLADQQLHDLADGHQVHALAARHVVERPLGERE
jgi:hypothetical protein